MPIGSNVFKDINEVKPGNYIIFDKGNITTVRYFKLKSYTHTDDIITTKNKVKNLLEESIKMQTVSDVPLGCLLSRWT